MPLIIYQILTMLIIVRLSEQIKEKTKEFNSVLFKQMEERDHLCRNKKLQLYVIMKQTINFSACGFFTLNYSFVASMIAAATTYLVILVQFSLPSKDNKEDASIPVKQ
ncbi:putative gustatory receptor 28b [Cimex lectularius]|uniref:Gustatory receptor n=1 Tax=Cimex lectularius TaxID=79782 RepID=A0A8I6R970_CIMLE|nr:putative gustatory receptor 28b [Cimex lectularius]